MLTLAKIDAGSIEYYESTVDREHRPAALTDYYEEKGDAVPRAFVLGDDAASAERAASSMFSVEDGDRVPEQTVRAWLMRGENPATGDPLGRRVQERSVIKKGTHAGELRKGVAGFDLTFGAPKSVSLVYALGQEAQRDAVDQAHAAAVRTSLEYLQKHVAYTRRREPGNTNPEDNSRIFERLATFAGVSYEHRASRARDPHVHTHCLLSNRQVRQDGQIGTLDGVSLYDESRAAGLIYQAALRAELTRTLGVEWGQVDERTGMADLLGFSDEQIRAWSQRHSELTEWATAREMDGTAAQLDMARRDTRAAKSHEGKSREEVRAEWQADSRAEGIDLTAGAGIIGRVQDAQVQEPSIRPEPATVLAHIAQTKAKFTRADIVESVATLWPIKSDPRTLLAEIEAGADEVAKEALPLTERDRLNSERERAITFSCSEVIKEEARLLVSATAQDENLVAEVEELTDIVALGGLSEDQRRAVLGIAGSDERVSPLVAPAGAGKTFSLSSLREVYEQDGRTVVALAPSGRAADQLRSERVADEARTIAAWKSDHEQGRTTWDSKTVVVVDEAGMVGTHDFAELVEAAEAAGAKVVAVGDPRQLEAVQQRGGIFSQLEKTSASTQKLTEVWRQRDEYERAAGILLRDGNDEGVEYAARWYEQADRLRCGSQTAMVQDAYTAWRADRAQGKDALLLASSWEYADAANLRAQLDAGTLTEDGPQAVLSKEQKAGVGDILMTRANDYATTAWQVDEAGRRHPAGTVMNSHRWRVDAIRANGSVQVTRVNDDAVATLSADYLSKSAHLGYAGTVHAAQGATADHVHAVLDADSTTRSALYVAASRGKESNHLYFAERRTGDDEHEWTTAAEATKPERGTSDEARTRFEDIVTRDDRPRTAHQAMEEQRQAEIVRQREERDREKIAYANGQREHRPETTQNRSAETPKPTRAEQASESAMDAKRREIAQKVRAQQSKRAQSQQQQQTQSQSQSQDAGQSL